MFSAHYSRLLDFRPNRLANREDSVNKNMKYVFLFLNNLNVIINPIWFWKLKRGNQEKPIYHNFLNNDA